MNTQEAIDFGTQAATLARAFPHLSAYTAASYAADLARLARAQQRHAERLCSDCRYGDPDTVGTAAESAECRIARACAKVIAELPGLDIERHGDPRGGYFVVRVGSFTFHP